MATFIWIPDAQPDGQFAPNVSVVKFGDGYEQRQEQGINSLAEAWAVAFSNRPESEAMAIHAFLKARRAKEWFDWTSPLGDAVRVVCRSWNVQRGKGNLRTVTATFEQVFDNG